jgi:hypothetical protein
MKLDLSNIKVLGVTGIYFLGLLLLSIGMSFEAGHFFAGFIPFGIGTVIWAIVKAMVDDYNK